MICVTRINRLVVSGIVPVCALFSASAWSMSLSEAFALAQQHDPLAVVTEARYAADLEASAADRASHLPTLSVGGRYEYANTDYEGVFGGADDEYPAWSAQVTARQPLFRLDWFARRDRADALDLQAEATYKDGQLELLQRVADRYFGVLTAQEEMAQAEAEAAAVRESLEDTRKRYEVELVPGTDLKEAQARDDLAQARLLSAKTGLETARDALDEVTGNGYVALPELPENIGFPALAPADVDAWVQAAQAQSPAILLAQQAAAVAKADRSSSLSASMPSLDLVASAGRDDTTEYVYGQKTDDARVGVELSLPIYAGGELAARRRQADAGLRAADADLRRVTLETARTVRQMYRKVETAYYESDAYKRSLESAQAAEAATRAGYDAGTRTITDVLDAKSRVVQARRDLNNTRYNLLLSLLQLKRLTGELSSADFAEIDRLLAYPSQ